MVTQYKCPNCGSDLSFDVDSGMLKCPSCCKTMPIDQVPKSESNNISNDATPDVDMFNPNNIQDECSYEYTGERNTPKSTFSDSDVHEYQCNNCGAIILAERDTTATNCSFCGSPVVLADRLSGNLAPAKVIPFRITKDEAQA
ncbi:MAG: hypothetical protein PUC65_04715, partial [Clostridiales bacterium]|nr:hypothetical protein [Clostridiales bacterium]